MPGTTVIVPDPAPLNVDPVAQVETTEVTPCGHVHL